jgi:pimeloyl-ACP methyl ester carboxylesterase
MLGSNALTAIEFKDPRSNLESLPAEREKTVQQYEAESDPNWKELRAQSDTRFQTVRFVSKLGRVPTGAARSKIKARILLLHGTSALTSRSEAMRSILNILSTQNIGKSGDSLKKIQAVPHYQPYACEAIDLPGHGLGPPLVDFQNLDQTARWLGEYLKAMKEETPDLPLVVFTRSGSGPIISRTNQLYPGLISGLILMSPPFPGDEAIIDQGISAMKDSFANEGNSSSIIPELIRWNRANKLSISWKDYDFKGVPTLIFTGSEDEKLTAPERDWYKRIAAKFPGNVEYYDVPGAKHDVLRLSTGSNGNTLPPVLDALGHIYAFTDRIVSRH